MYFEDKAASDLIIVVNAVLSLTSVLSVSVRFQRPGAPERGMDLQNIMLALAAFCGTIMSILQCVATKYGLGAHMADLDQEQTLTFLKLYPAIMSFYYACNMFVKFGLLIFYLRTTYERSNLYAIWIMIFIAFGFGISNVVVTLFQCTPPDKLWHPKEAGFCVNIMRFYYANAIIMIVNDTVMYIMPIVFTWNLALRRPQRIVLNLLFALGAVVVLTSILRLLALVKFDQSGGTDLSYGIASILLWSAVENHTAIFIACSPSIKALVVGTLVPLVSSVHSSMSERVKSFRGSQATPHGTGVDSHNSHRYDAGQIQHQLAMKILGKSGRRQSMDSDNSRLDLTATREHRQGSSASSIGFPKINSQNSINKEVTVSVMPFEEVEPPTPSTLPPYTYLPKQHAKK